jgi:hypothetical protein
MVVKVFFPPAPEDSESLYNCYKVAVTDTWIYEVDYRMVFGATEYKHVEGIVQELNKMHSIVSLDIVL